jgi:hypothetical protein
MSHQLDILAGVQAHLLLLTEVYLCGMLRLTSNVEHPVMGFFSRLERKMGPECY